MISVRKNAILARGRGVGCFIALPAGPPLRDGTTGTLQTRDSFCGLSFLPQDVVMHSGLCYFISIPIILVSNS